MEKEEIVELPDLEGPAYKLVKLDASEIAEVNRTIDVMLREHQSA